MGKPINVNSFYQLLERALKPTQIRSSLFDDGGQIYFPEREQQGSPLLYDGLVAVYYVGDEQVVPDCCPLMALRW